MDPVSKNPAARQSPALAIGVLAGALLLTIVGAIVAALFWRQLPFAQVKAASSEFRARHDALLGRISGEALDGKILWGAASVIAPQVLPRAREVRSTGKELQDAMSLRSTQLGRLIVATSILARAESEGRAGEQAWAAAKPYLQGLERASFAHFGAALQNVWIEIFRTPPVQEGTAHQAASQSMVQNGEAFTPVLQFLIPRLKAMAEQRTAAGDVAGADVCRKTSRRLLREWTLEPGRVGTRLVAADLLTRELDGDPANGKLVESLRAWRKAYRDSARQRPTPLLGVGGDEPDLCPAEHAALVGSVATSLWLFVATAAAGLAALALSWALLRESAAIRDWRILAAGGIVAIAATASAGMVIRNGGPAVGDDLRGLMARVAGPKPVKPKRADTWHPVYRAQLPWAAAGWTVVALAAGALGGAALYGKNRLAGAAGVLAIGWLLIAIAWTAQSAWGGVRVNRYESALADAYRKGVYAAVAGDSAEALLAPLRDWRP